MFDRWSNHSSFYLRQQVLTISLLSFIWIMNAALPQRVGEYSPALLSLSILASKMQPILREQVMRSLIALLS